MTIVNYAFNVPRVLELLRTGETTRFHTKRLLFPQDTGQHGYRVALLAYALTDGRATSDLLLAALTHDAGERYTGDMPAPVKRRLGLRETLQKLEDQLLEERTGFCAPTLCAMEDLVLKAADALDGLAYCVQEMQYGNRTLEATARSFAEYVEELLPALQDQSALLRNNVAELLGYLHAQLKKHYP